MWLQLGDVMNPAVVHVGVRWSSGESVQLGDVMNPAVVHVGVRWSSGESVQLRIERSRVQSPGDAKKVNACL